MKKNIDNYKKRGGHLPTKQSRRLTLQHTQIPPNNVICQKKPPMKDVKRYIHFSDGRGEGERGGTGEGGGCVRGGGWGWNVCGGGVIGHHHHHHRYCHYHYHDIDNSHYYYYHQGDCVRAVRVECVRGCSRDRGAASPRGMRGDTWEPQTHACFSLFALFSYYNSIWYYYYSYYHFQGLRVLVGYGGHLGTANTCLLFFFEFGQFGFG